MKRRGLSTLRVSAPALSPRRSSTPRRGQRAPSPPPPLLYDRVYTPCVRASDMVRWPPARDTYATPAIAPYAAPCRRTLYTDGDVRAQLPFWPAHARGTNRRTSNGEGRAAAKGCLAAAAGCVGGRGGDMGASDDSRHVRARPKQRQRRT